MKIVRVLGTYMATQRDKEHGGGYFGRGKTVGEAISSCIRAIERDIQSQKEEEAVNNITLSYNVLKSCLKTHSSFLLKK